MKSRAATPLELSCTLLPSCCTFFSLYSFRLYLGSVWFASARQCSGPETVLSFSPSSPLNRPSFAGPLQSPRPARGPHDYQPLVFTSDQVGGDLDKTTNKLKYSPLAPSLRLAWCRHASSIAGEKRRTEETVRTNTRKANGDPYTRRQALGAHRNEAERDSRLTGLEDLSKQNPNLSSSHVLRAERWRRTRGGEGG